MLDESIFQSYWFYFLFLGFNIFLTILLNKIFLKFSKNLGRRESDIQMVRWSGSKPALGGITFFLIFLFSMAFSLLFSGNTNFDKLEFVGFIGAVGLGFLLGLSDDAYNTKPLLKFSTQVACGVLLIVTGTYISIFESNVINYGLTIFWVVALMNSINMLDNMDAITTTVSIFILLTVIMLILLHNPVNYVFVLICVGVLGALIGFLYHNWNPSVMYMGDTGSQFLGVFLAGISIVYLWNNKELKAIEEVPTKQFSITLMAFILPIIDTATVSINRILRGQSPFVGGKDHTTHFLSYLGFSDKQVALIFGAIGALSIVLVYLIVSKVNNWGYSWFFLFAGYFVLVFSILFGITKLNSTLVKFNDKNK